MADIFFDGFAAFVRFRGMSRSSWFHGRFAGYFSRAILRRLR
jgi:hypothetical protein